MSDLYKKLTEGDDDYELIRFLIDDECGRLDIKLRDDQIVKIEKSQPAHQFKWIDWDTELSFSSPITEPEGHEE